MTGQPAPLTAWSRTVGYAVRLLPWWGAAAAVIVFGVVRNPWPWPVGAVVVVVAAAVGCALIWVGVARSLGYVPIDVDELPGDQLVHLSQARREQLLTPDGEHVHLDAARCRLMSRMLRADQPWRVLKTPAVYFFTGQPSRGDVRANVALQARSMVVLAQHDVPGGLYRRWDGCIAVPGGYTGPGRVVALAAQAGGRSVL